jgi:hypothetical protein
VPQKVHERRGGKNRSEAEDKSCDFSRQNPSVSSFVFGVVAFRHKSD